MRFRPKNIDYATVAIDSDRQNVSHFPQIIPTGDDSDKSKGVSLKKI